MLCDLFKFCIVSRELGTRRQSGDWYLNAFDLINLIIVKRDPYVLNLKLVYVSFKVKYKYLFIWGNYDWIVHPRLFLFKCLLLDIVFYLFYLQFNLILFLNQLIILASEVLLELTVLVSWIGSDSRWFLHEVNQSLLWREYRLLLNICILQPALLIKLLLIFLFSELVVFINFLFNI